MPKMMLKRLQCTCHQVYQLESWLKHCTIDHQSVHMTVSAIYNWKLRNLQVTAPAECGKCGQERGGMRLHGTAGVSTAIYLEPWPIAASRSCCKVCHSWNVTTHTPYNPYMSWSCIEDNSYFFFWTLLHHDWCSRNPLLQQYLHWWRLTGFNEVATKN